MGELRRPAERGRGPAERPLRLSDLPARLFASGHAVDLVLAVLLVEALWLVLGEGRRSASVALPLLPGALLLLALRAALAGAAWPWVALPLLLSFPVHLADLAARRRSWDAGRERSIR